MKKEIDFIRLHETNDNKPIVIRKKCITTIYKHIDVDSTTVEFFDGESQSDILVNESPDKIFNSSLNEAQFIRLHDSDDNTPVIFNKDKIVFVGLQDDNTTNGITIFAGLETFEYTIKESPEQVYSILIEEKKKK